MSDNSAASAPQRTGADWLLGIRFFLLTFTLAGILGSAVTVSSWARWILNNWDAMNTWLSDIIIDALVSVFGLHLYWGTKRLIPLFLIGIAVLAIGYARQGIPRLAEMDMNLTNLLARLISIPIVMALMLLIFIRFEQTDSNAIRDNQNFVKATSQCHAKLGDPDPLSVLSDPKCADALKTYSEGDKGKLTVLDFAFGAIAMLVSLTIAMFYPFEVIAATVAACLFLGLGMIDLRPFVGPP
jgi:hypothetical protein